MSPVNPHTETLIYYDRNAQPYTNRTLIRLDLDALRTFTEKLPTGARVLDAGCGSGRDLKYFHEQGLHAEGFDGSPAIVKIAQQNLSSLGIKVWQSDFMLTSLLKEHYDGIWAYDIFIHLSPVECQRLMNTFFMALKSKGILFLSFETGEGTVEDRKDSLEGPPRHIFRYLPDSFSSLVKQHGFQILALGNDLKKAHRMAVLAQRI